MTSEPDVRVAQSRAVSERSSRASTVRRKAAKASVERHADPQTVSILRQSTDMLDRGLSCSPEESADDLLELLTIAGRMHLARLARKLAAALEAMLGEIEETQATQDLRADLFSALSWSAKLYGDLQRAARLQSAEVDVLVEIADRSGTREDRLKVLVARVRLAWVRARARESEAARATVDEVVEAHGVTILGPSNVPSSLPYHASQMFSKNVLVSSGMMLSPLVLAMVLMACNTELYSCFTEAVFFNNFTRQRPIYQDIHAIYSKLVTKTILILIPCNFKP